MLHVVTRENSHLYREQIEEHFRIRYDIYVRQRKWVELDRPDEREIDQFDTPNAIYLLALDEGRVVGGTRLVPSVFPHLMSEVFPELANVRGLQRGPDIVEWTRYFILPQQRSERGPSPLAGLIMAGILEFCLDEGFRAITVVMETLWLPRMFELGWRVHPLGEQKVIGPDLCCGVLIDVDEETLEKTRSRRSVPAGLLTRQGLTQPIMPSILSQRGHTW